MVMVIRDTKGHVFGGFASVSWSVKSHFVGMCPTVEIVKVSCGQVFCLDFFNLLECILFVVEVVD